MNIGKNKHCVMNRAHTEQLISFVHVISTVGVTPRKQVSTKSTTVCVPCLSSFTALNRPETTETLNTALEKLTGTPEALTKPSAQQSDVAPTMKLVFSMMGRHAARSRWKKKRSRS